MSSFSQMREALRLICMGALGTTLQDADVYGSLINQSHSELTEQFEWSWRLTNAIINTVMPKSAGTVTVSTGSPVVLGSGTHFTVADKGSFIWVGGIGSTPLPIADVSGGQIVTLAHPFAGQTMQGTGYRCAPLYYLVEGSQEILEVSSENYRLEKRLREEINRLDPTRSDQGGAPSTLWCQAPPSPDGSLMLEFWPVASDSRAYLVEYRRRAPLLVRDGDLPLVPSTCVVEHAAITACEMMYTSTGQRSWIELANRHHTNLYGDGGTDEGKLQKALNRDAAIQQYRGRAQRPSDLWSRGYDAGFDPLHNTFDDF